MFPKDRVQNFKKAVVFLGSINEHGEVVPHATGFLVMVKGLYHVVTAKHVIYDDKTDSFRDLYIHFNTIANTTRSVRISNIKRNLDCDWIFHENKDIDVGIIPFKANATDDLALVPQDIFLPSDKLFELHDIFFLSFQPGIESKERISPIIRTGSISIVNEDGSFYIDAAAFPGNSGSPVFLRPSLMYDNEVHSMGGGYFIGVIGSYLPYNDIAISTQTGRPRVIFEENTGLSKVWSASFLSQIVNSAAFQQQLTKIPKID